MLSQMLQRLRGKALFALPQPDQPLAIIGDIHGCLDLLQGLLAKLPAETQVILVGDYIDRGEDSQGVLQLLTERPDLICLRGNHEEMMIQFLTDPTSYGRRWLQHGGLQTLASFGIVGVHTNASLEALEECRGALLVAMGADLQFFLQNLRPWYLSGNVLVAHAGADPAKAPESQDPQNLIWGHPNFEKTPRQDGIWVVYGHVIQGHPKISKGRIAIDTGAYATGRLTAAYISPGMDPVFISSQR